MLSKTSPAGYNKSLRKLRGSGFLQLLPLVFAYAFHKLLQPLWKYLATSCRKTVPSCSRNVATTLLLLFHHEVSRKHCSSCSKRFSRASKDPCQTPVVTLSDSFNFAEQNTTRRLQQVSSEASRSAFNSLRTYSHGNSDTATTRQLLGAAHQSRGWKQVAEREIVPGNPGGTDGERSRTSPLPDSPERGRLDEPMAKEVPLRSLTTQAHPFPFLYLTTSQITYPLSTVTGSGLPRGRSFLGILRALSTIRPGPHRYRSVAGWTNRWPRTFP